MPTPKIPNRTFLISNVSFLIPILTFLAPSCNKPLPNPAPLPIQPTLTPKPEAKPVTSRAINARDLYTANCATCHAIDGTGQLGEPSNLRHSTLTPEQTTEVITFGRPNKGMMAYQSMLTTQEIDSLTAHVMRLHQDDN